MKDDSIIVLTKVGWLRPLILGMALYGLVGGAYAAPRSVHGTIHFFGTSTLHDFSGELATGPFELDVSRDPDTQVVKVGAALSLPVSGMTTHHAKRDANMFKMLESGHVPRLTGLASNVVIAADGTATVPLTLGIGGVSKTIMAQVVEWKDDGTVISGKLSFTLSLSQFGLKPPSVLGVIRVGDAVRIECSLDSQPATNLNEVHVASKE